MEERLHTTKMEIKGFGTEARLLTDEETGVQYIFVAGGYAGGLSVRVDRDGKPMIDPAYDRTRL